MVQAIELVGADEVIAEALVLKPYLPKRITMSRQPITIAPSAMPSKAT